MVEPGRKFVKGSSKYRYGFNGKENDNEVKGDGNQQDYGMRIYDPRLGKFLSVDPITSMFSMLTPYQFASNNPILFIDIDGLEGGKPKSIVYNIFDVQNKWVDGGPRKEVKIDAVVQLKVLDLTKIKTQATSDYISYMTMKSIKYNAFGYDYQYIAFDEDGNPDKTNPNGSHNAKMIGGEIKILVNTQSIKSYSDINKDDYVYILADNVVGTNGEVL